MKRDARIFVEHVLECIDLIEGYVKDKTEDDFLKSVQLQDSIVRRIEVIGEAVKQMPREAKEKYTEIPWKKIASMRDLLIHEYFGVDLKLTWEVVMKDIPELKKQMLKIKGELE